MTVTARITIFDHTKRAGAAGTAQPTEQGGNPMPTPTLQPVDATGLKRSLASLREMRLELGESHEALVAEHVEEAYVALHDAMGVIEDIPGQRGRRDWLSSIRKDLADLHEHLTGRCVA